MELERGLMVMQDLEIIAFDLGGVLAHLDFLRLSKEEIQLYYLYMNRFNKEISREELEYIKRRLPDIIVKLYILNDEAEETLKMLKDYKVKPSIWTNGIKEMEAWFESINLYRYIAYEDIVNSYFLNVDKPMREFYEKALKIINVRPSKVLFYDDKKENVEAACLMGIAGIQFDGSRSLKNTVKKDIERRGL